MIRLKEIRKKAGISQKELASILEITQQAIYKYENGLAEPDIRKLIVISDYFGVSMDYLIGRTELCNASEMMKNSISLSGLEDEDIKIIYGLISILREKNNLIGVIHEA